MAQLQRSMVNPPGVSPPIGLYSQVARVRPGELLFIAGQVSIDEDGNLVGEGDIAAQARQTIRNIGRILEGVGASFSNVVEFTTYVVGKENVRPYLEGRAGPYAEAFPDGDYPPNTLLVIDGLVREEFLLEISTVAALP